MSEKLELTYPQTAEKEKRLATHAKNIAAYASGVRKSGAQMFGYAFLAGREMNLAAEVLPHGEICKWVRAKFPDISNGTAGNWRSFAQAAGSKFPTVGNLKPLALKKSFTKTEQSTILEAIPALMDDKGMIEFTRAAGFSRAPKLAGGERIDKQAVKQWCSEYHPEMPAAQCEALPGKLKREFLSWAAIQATNTKFEITDDQSAQEDIAALQAMTARQRKGCSIAVLKELLEAKDALGRAVSDELTSRKNA